MGDDRDPEPSLLTLWLPGKQVGIYSVHGKLYNFDMKVVYFSVLN